MTINFLEKSAEMFFKFCKMHPELCPHDFEWYLSGQRNENGELIICETDYTKQYLGKGSV